MAQEFLLANINNLDTFSDVVLEEYGHFIDSQLNVVDAPGDEGAIFSTLVRGEDLGKSELQQLKSDDDTAVVVLDGRDVAIKQNSTGTTTIVSIASDGSRANDNSDKSSASDDGRYVAFTSSARNLVLGDTNNKSDIFVRDRTTGIIERVSVTSDGFQANSRSNSFSINHAFAQKLNLNMILQAI